MKSFAIILSLLATTAAAAPTEADKESIEKVFDYSGMLLGSLLECDAIPLYSQYRTALADAMHAYPGTDPVKVRALLRKIDRQAEVLGSLGIKRTPNPTPEEIETHQAICRHHIRMATSSLQELDDFILQ